MKKSIKSVLAKSLAVVMAFSLAGIAPSTSSDAAAKKPTVTKKVSVKVGKTKTVKVTSKKKVKKTTWSLTKAGKKIVSLSKKKKKSVTVKGKKAGKATLTAKIKVGKKTYKKTCKVTVTKAAVTTKPTVKPTDTATTKPTATATNNSGGNGGNGGNGGSTTPSARPTPAVPPASSLTVDGKTLTVDEESTYRLELTELNETTFTCDAKRPIGAIINNNEVTEAHSDILYNRDGSVTFSSNATYNSGVSYYINPCTSESDIVDLSDTRGEGFLGYNNGTKDMFSYDYVRVVLSSENEMNCRTYNGNDQLLSAGFPGSSTSETYEGGWIGPAENYMEAGSKEAGNTVKEDYVTRTVFIPIESLMSKGMNPETLTAIAFCPQSSGEEVTIYDVAFVKVNYDTKVTGIEVTSNKTEVANGRTANLTATVTPDDATRKIVKWTSSNEELATVNYAGTVVAAAEGTGEVTFTATATDGSDVSGSITLKIGESTAPAKIVSHKMDLSDSNIVAKTTSSDDYSTTVATQSAAGIEFAKKGSMLAVDFSAYLTANSLDLANYDSLKVTYQLKNSDGTDAETGDATYGKVCLVPAATLNGYGDGVNTSGKWMDAYFSGTKEVSFAGITVADLGTVAGFNFQVSSTAEDQYYVISDITLYKDNNVYFDLTDSGIVGKTNPGQGESIAATQSAAGIAFTDGGSMTFVNFSEYLTANSLDLADYKALEVVWEVQDAEGNTVTDYAGAEGTPTYGKICYVPVSTLDGCSGGIDTNYEGADDTTANTAWLTEPYTGQTCTLTIAKTNPTELATVAGFNLQLQSVPAGMYIVVKSITLISE